MVRFIVGRLVGSVVVLWIIVTLSFFLMRFAPGGPFDKDRKLPPNVEANKWILYGMGIELTAPVAGTVDALGDIRVQAVTYPEDTLLAVIRPDGGGPLAEVRLPSESKVVAMGTAKGEHVDAGSRIAVVPKPLTAQYWDAIGSYMRLDFGKTFDSEGTVAVKDRILKALPISLELGGFAMLFALLVGVTAGLLAGLKHNTWVDYSVMSASMVGVSIPTMVSAPILIAIFVLGLGWFPATGWEPALGSEFATWQYRVLPVLTLGIAYVPIVARLSRGGMLDVVRSDWIRTARAKGLSEGAIVRRHALKAALLPTISWLGPGMAGIVTGSVVVEKIYGIPGLADEFIQPALSRDYPMVIGTIVVYSAILVLLNLCVDIAYTLLDPRVRLA